MISLLPDLIFVEQGAFVSGRNISDNIRIVHELAYEVNKKTRGGNMIIKLNMDKTFDRIEWKFLFQVLTKFGFSQLFINLAKMLVIKLCLPCSTQCNVKWQNI
ncbi:hypothetical protein KSP39_PZI007805 [Platanthera zijinensis]|uniref:Reverse transcriptase domain-containing protein n=1 Tax=Platanthera zijinensis TaxID=2320716 RepID=A0AAP0BNZ7_9ASPA